MKTPSIILAAALFLSGAAPVESTLGVRPATAQVPAPTAAVIPGHPSYAAGAPAMFKGRDFAPGEVVTFQVTHVRGTPVTNQTVRGASVTGANHPVQGMSVPGLDHTPAAVMADRDGAFLATWQVCSTDCVGELLQIEATGQTSGRVGRAVFMDLPAPPPSGTQTQQVRHADGAANRRADHARANFANATAAPTFDRIASFGTPGIGAYPNAGLIQGTDGAFYGTAINGGTFGLGTVFKLNSDGTGATVLKNFDYSSGAYPYARLVQGTDGALYGTAYQGGSGGAGVAFKLNTDGTGFTVLKNFDYGADGGNVYSWLLQGTDGALYGTAHQGGALGAGTVFKLNTDGTGFTVLQNLNYSTIGGYPGYAGLTQGPDGTLYGTASGGAFGGGTLFKLNTDGTGFTVLQNLDYSNTGAYAYGGLTLGSDGALYGTALQGGPSTVGTVFKLNTDGTGFTVLQSFDYSNGGYPYAGLVQGTDGALYGTTILGGTFGAGTAFKLNTDGTGFTVLKNFDNGADGGYAYGGLVQGTDGALYGTTYQGGSNGAGAAFKMNTDGTGFIVLKSFSNGADGSGGAYPYAGVVQGTDGALYGTAYQGGTANAGNVFKLNSDGTGFAVLQNLDFSTTGGNPFGGLIQGADGALYGTAAYGGPSGSGTVFKLNTDGTGFTVLKSFGFSDGAYPYARMVQGTDGALYGTTYYGGSGTYGTVFKLNTDGTGFTVLRNFDYSTTGGYVFSGLIQGADGALYGTAFQGGAGGYGTAFKLNTDGTGFTVLQNFDYSTNGGYVYAGLVQGTDGALYGTTVQGGTSGVGTAFKLNTDGTGFTVLQSFGYSPMGAYPYAGMVQGTDGALYGMAYAGGVLGAGTVFKLNTDGSDFTVVKSFDGGADGGYPQGGALARGTDGNLYGTTPQGGDAGIGTVFRLVFENANNPPVARCKDVTVSAGAGCTAAASIDDGSSDPDAGDTITLAQAPPGPYPLGATSVTLTVTDSHGASSSCMATVTVTNPAPVATITGPASGSAFAVNTAVPFTGTWTDANGGAHTAQWAFDGTPDASFAAGTGTSGPANTSHTFTAAGVYLVQLTVTDACGGAGTASQVGGVDAMVVIYDPSAGFVTGGGWIQSPAGAYTADPALTGRANFGFVSRYKKGAAIPTGETEFQYKVGNLNFHSTSYDWLVVSGARAQYKGSGTINNAGDYSFILTAIDGEISGGGGADKFRMKITNKTGGGLVYDNLLNAPDSDDPTTVLGGGSIVIHTGGNSMSATASGPRAEGGGEQGFSATMPVEFGLSQNSPNPFDRSTQIAFSLPERSRVSLVVYDLVGREVRTLVDGEWEPGRHSATMSRTGSDGSRLDAGVYFVRMNAQSLASGRSFSSLRKMVLVK